MRDAWEILAASGVPVGAIRPVPRHALDAAPLRDALAMLTKRPDMLTERESNPLFAWLRGFQHHWPARFGGILGDAGAAALAALGTQPIDPNRYLKLRRIAIENLAHVL